MVQEMLDKWGKHRKIEELKSELESKLNGALKLNKGPLMTITTEHDPAKDFMKIKSKNSSGVADDKFDLHVAKSGSVSSPNAAAVSSDDDKAILAKQMVTAYMAANNTKDPVDIKCEDKGLKEMLEKELKGNGYKIEKSPLEEKAATKAEVPPAPEEDKTLGLK